VEFEGYMPFFFSLVFSPGILLGVSSHINPFDLSSISPEFFIFIAHGNLLSLPSPPGRIVHATFFVSPSQWRQKAEGGVTLHHQ